MIKKRQNKTTNMKSNNAINWSNVYVFLLSGIAYTKYIN